MTQKFDNFLKNILEAISFQENGLLPDEYNNFPHVKSEYLVNGIYLHDWDLKDFSGFKNLLKKADSEKKYIFGQAYPYLTKDRMREQGKNKEEIEKEFVKDRNRLLNMYSKFGFIHTRNGWIYRPYKTISEMTDASVFGADGPYPTDDTRVPVVLGTYTRNGKVKKRRRKKKKKN